MFCRFAQEFELLAIALDDSDDQEQRMALLRRMRAVIEGIDELVRQNAVGEERIHDHELDRFLVLASKVEASIAGRRSRKKIKILYVLPLS
jgi:hypothetical protein